MSDENGESFKFVYITWMTDHEIMRLLGAVPKKDITNICGHLDIQTISLACKMCNEVLVRRIYINLSASDRAEFLRVSRELDNCKMEEIFAARKIIEFTADQLEFSGEIGEWTQKYAA